MTTTSKISSLGVGSGLDAESIVNQLVALERQPINTLQSKVTQIQTKISAYGQVKSYVSALRDAAQKLSGADLWAGMKAASSDTNVVNFATTSGAAVGNYNVTVNALAAAQSVASRTGIPSNTAVGAGRLYFEVASSFPTSLDTGNTTAPYIDVTATDTLSDIRDKINAKNAGVNASIINDASGARLVMTSSATGTSNAFRVTATDDSGTITTGTEGLAALAYDPSKTIDDGTGAKLNQAAANASATINGVTVSSTTNTFTNVMDGITMTVSKLTLSPVSVNVTKDTEAITKAVTDFASAYSALSSYLKTSTKYDETSKTAGTLQGDSMATSTLNQFRSLIGANSAASTVFSTLSSVGLEIQSTGTMTVNSTKLNSAMGNLAEMKKLFTNPDTGGGPATEGMATRLRTLADSMLSIDGAITTRTEGLNKAIAENKKRQDALDGRVALFEKRLRAQYTALDKAMASISTQSNYVTQMINSFNKNS